MFFVTDRASREELKAGMVVSFQDLFNQKQLKSFKMTASNIWHEVCFCCHGSKKICFSLIDFQSVMTKDLLLHKGIESLICNLLNMDKGIFVAGIFVKAKRRCSSGTGILQIDDYMNLKFRDILPAQGIVSVVVINLGKNTFLWKGQEIVHGTLSFINVDQAIGLNDLYTSEEFEGLVMFLISEKNGMFLRHKKALFTFPSLKSMSNIKNIEDKKLIEEYDLPFIKDIGLRNV